MCLAIYAPVPKGHSRRASHIPNEYIDAAFSRHRDGYGLAWAADGVLHVERFAPADQSGFRAAVKRVDASGVTFGAHFRLATSGPKDATSAHPSVYSDPDPVVGDVAIFHNGVIDIKHDQARESDTAAFVRQVLAKMPSRWWTLPWATFLVGEAIGWSKLVVIAANGETALVNESSGTWDAGIWYSSTYKPMTARTPAWTAAKQTAASNPKPTTHQSKRSQRKRARVERHAARRPSPPDPFVPDSFEPSLPVPIRGPLMLASGGHPVEALVDIDRTRDGDYIESVECTICGTFGDLFIVDGRAYVDLRHRQYTDLLATDRDSRLDDMEGRVN